MAPRYSCLICRHPIPGPGEECPHCKSRQSTPVGATPQLLVIVFVVMLALFVGTGYYNRAFNNQRQQRAEEHYRLGRTFADYGYYDGAIEHFRDALLYDRSHFEYRLGLTLALYESERYQEAELQLRELRTADPTDAAVNRMLARLARRGRRVEEAVQYYRTAIYGRWAQNPEENRIETRLEFIDFLEEEGETNQLSGELLSLLREEPGDADLTRRAGLLLVNAGSPGEAIRVLRPLAEQPAGDGEIYAALGRAYFATGEYGMARRELQRALASTTDPELLELLEECSEIIALDPNYRRVSRREPRVTQLQRFRRSREVLARTEAYLESCVNPLGEELTGPPAPLSTTAEAAFDAAREALADERRPDDYGDAVDQNMGAAAALWAHRAELCTNLWNEDDALRRVMEESAR